MRYWTASNKLNVSIITLCVFVADRFFKYYFLSQKNLIFPVIGRFFSFEYFENYGIAFGIPLPQFFVLIITPFILLFLVTYFLNTHRNNAFVFFGSFCIVAGAVSNFMDRVLYGFTIDYIRFGSAIINIADVQIFFGAVLIVIALFFDKKQNTL